MEGDAGDENALTFQQVLFPKAVPKAEDGVAASETIPVFNGRVFPVRAAVD
jgi:hypothetical protein